MARAYQSIQEIEQHYPNELVLIDAPKTTRSEEVLGGFVICHGRDKSVLVEVIKKLPQPCHVAVRYIGAIWTSSGDAFV